MDVVSELFDFFFMFNTKTMLFINNQKPKILEMNVPGQQTVGSNDYINSMALVNSTERYQGQITLYKPVNSEDQSQGILLVPEPSIILLLGAGLMATGLISRKR